MERYRQQFPKLISIEDWLAKAHPEAPALPWLSDDGVEVCSFVVMAMPQPGEVLVVLYDAHGREVVRSANTAAIEATCLALTDARDELVFLPKVETGRAVEPHRLPRSVHGEDLSVVEGPYTEAGWHREANLVTITDGERTAVYAPIKTL